jgi:hypothetical protein
MKTGDVFIKESDHNHYLWVYIVTELDDPEAVGSINTELIELDNFKKIILIRKHSPASSLNLSNPPYFYKQKYHSIIEHLFQYPVEFES